jgi:hypothetical protein
MKQTAILGAGVMGETLLSGLVRAGRRVDQLLVGEKRAERAAELEEGFERFPEFLRQLRATSRDLRRFSDAGTPVITEFGESAPDVTRAQRALAPLADAATPAVKTLGDAAEESQDDIVASDPVIKDVRDLARAAKPGANQLNELLSSLDREICVRRDFEGACETVTTGFRSLMDFFFNTSAAVNGFDEYGHYLRTFALVTNCTRVISFPVGGCGANFVEEETPSTASAAELLRTLGAERNPAARSGGVSPDGRAIQPDRLQPAPVAPRPQPRPQGPSEQGQGSQELVPGAEGTGGRESLRGGKALFRFLMEGR